MAITPRTELRRQKKLEKQQKSLDKAAKLAERLGSYVKEPRSAAEVPKLIRSKDDRTPRSGVQVDDSIKKPRLTTDPTEAFAHLHVTWCSTNSDTEGEWTWGESRNWSEKEWDTDIVAGLDEIKRNTWHDVIFNHKVKVGRKKKKKLVAKHHSQEVSTLCAEAQERWKQQDLTEYDTAFRFRFGGTKRAWGIRLGGHFYLIWWERLHKIYPVN